MNSEERLRSVEIKKQDNHYFAIAKFHLDGEPDIKTEPTETLNHTVYELQEILTPFTYEEDKEDK